MRRIGLAVLFTIGLLAAPLAAGAQQAAKVPRIGFLTATSLAAASVTVEAFRQGLRDLGYVEGRNVVIEYRDAEGKFERLPALAAELVAVKVDVIVAPTTPAVLAAKQATRTLKARKRSVSEDRRILGHLKNYFGKDTTLAEITASRISEYNGHGRSVKARVPSSVRSRERRSTARWPCCGTCFVSHTRSGSYSIRCPGSGWNARQKVGCAG